MTAEREVVWPRREAPHRRGLGVIIEPEPEPRGDRHKLHRVTASHADTRTAEIHCSARDLAMRPNDWTGRNEQNGRNPVSFLKNRNSQGAKP